MTYLQSDTPLPPYICLPLFLFQTELSETAKLVYALLLDRAKLSQTNGWTDEQGRVYIYYTIAELAKDCGKSKRTVQYALADLLKADLAVTQRQGKPSANRILLRVPDAKSCVPRVQKAASHRRNSLRPNQKKGIILNGRTYDFEEGESL